MFKKYKKINKVLILLPTLILTITIGYYFQVYKNSKNIYKDTSKVMNTIQQTLNLNTVNYNYSNVITIKKDKSISNIKLPFTEKSYIIKYNGVINAGVKPENINILKNSTDKIHIEVQKCEVLDHYIDSENVFVYDVKNSIFNKLKIQEVLDDISKYKKEYEEKALQEGLMNEIIKNTKSSIENILENIGYKEVIVSFK